MPANEQKAKPVHVEGGGERSEPGTTSPRPHPRLRRLFVLAPEPRAGASRLCSTAGSALHNAAPFPAKHRLNQNETKSAKA